ncbi:MAG: FAD-dependent oxidoreductase [Myxococcota bacterium]
MPMRHVIVGAGPAAQNAIETIRGLDADAEIELVCDEPAYSRMVLPYYLMGDVPEAGLSTGDANWFEELRVTTRFGHRVVALERDHDRVHLDDGTQLDFDRLLIATGSRPRRPDVPGAHGPGVVDLWTLADANSFLGAPHGDVVIVGAGFIAFTVLDAVAKRAKRVRFVEIEPRVLPRMLDPAAAAMVEARLAAVGIEVHKGVPVEALEAAGGRQRLTLAGGATLECDLAVMATGIQANTEFLEGSGVELDQAILVDEQLRTSRTNIYAAGDVAQGPDLFGGPRRVQAIQPVAVDHGRVAGANMAGAGIAYSGSLTVNILAAQGVEATSFGRWGEEGEVTVVANPASHIYRRYVFEEDRLVGGILVGPTLAVSGLNDVGMLKGLVQTGVRLGPWKAYLSENPMELRRVFVASGAARELLESKLLAGRVTGGGYRFPRLPARRPRPRHHASLVTGHT